MQRLAAVNHCCEALRLRCLWECWQRNAPVIFCLNSLQSEVFPKIKREKDRLKSISNTMQDSSKLINFRVGNPVSGFAGYFVALTFFGTFENPSF